MNKSTSSYIIYCRKSSESEERQVLSIESQIKELNELTKRLGLPVSEVLTESRSAKLPGRPVFGRLMEKIARGEVKGIVSWKLDRLARNPLDGGAIVWALDQGKILEIVTPYNRLNNNSNDKFLMQLEFGMAKKYVDDLSDNVRRGNRTKLEKGWLPGKAPLGYLNEPRERTIVPDPERFQIVRKMWELLLQGITPFRIHLIATEKLGLRPRWRPHRVGNPMSISAVYGLFTNPFYYGLIRRKGNVYQGKHEPMVTEEEFWRAQALLGRKGIPKPKTRSFSFTGLMKCGECGCGITAEEKVNRYGRHYIYYHCTKKKRWMKCSQKVIQEHELEEQMIQYLNQIQLPEGLLKIGLTYLRNNQTKDRELELTCQRSIEKALGEGQRRLENLKQMRLSDLINDEEYLQEKRKLIDEKIRLERNLEDQRSGKGNVSDLTANALTFASEAKNRFLNGSPEEKKGIFWEIGSNFLLKDKKLMLDVQIPFRLIDKALNTLRENNERIEPSKDVVEPYSIAPQGSNFLVMWTLAEDVRTFYEKKYLEVPSSAHHAA
jgi:DNA invertase Pin-like site-specific DNA recombinase